jgi:hypothetical protein
MIHGPIITGQFTVQRIIDGQNEFLHQDGQWRRTTISEKGRTGLFETRADAMIAQANSLPLHMYWVSLSLVVGAWINRIGRKLRLVR